MPKPRTYYKVTLDNGLEFETLAFDTREIMTYLRTQCFFDVEWTEVLVENLESKQQFKFRR